MNASATPLCSVCCETLGKYGGPVTLPCGHNGCLQCMASVRRNKPKCPLCRCNIPAHVELVENKELRDLIALASALHTVPCAIDGCDEHDEWEAVTSRTARTGSQKPDADSKSDITLVPTAPPAHMTLSRVMEGEADLLSLEPPSWLPDSHAQECGQCQKPFRAIRRARHHCRLCGGIFCAGCSSNALLLPPKFQKNQPERLCSACAALLEPLQPFLADGSALRSWLNSPLSSGLAADIYTATNILHSFAQVGQLQPEKGIPAAVLNGAVGFAILSVAKVGLGWSWAMGSGLVLVKQDSGEWSAPAALNIASVGWGFQAGGALHDLLIVLRNELYCIVYLDQEHNSSAKVTRQAKRAPADVWLMGCPLGAAVQAFCSGINCGVGGNVSLAVGPMGRQADANMRVGKGGAALCYSYSCSKGIFAGLAIEGTCIMSRDRANLDFYGRPLTARQLLTGNREGGSIPTAAAQPLYRALEDLLARVEAPVSASEASRPVAQGIQRTVQQHEAEEERSGRSRDRTHVEYVQSSALVPEDSSVHASQVMGAAEVANSSDSEEAEDEAEEEDNYTGAMFAE